jgi:hypothetical protein
MLLVGIMYASVVVFSAASMHYAVEGAARYYSVNVSSAAVSSPTFTASTPLGRTPSWA